MRSTPLRHGPFTIWFALAMLVLSSFPHASIAGGVADVDALNSKLKLLYDTRHFYEAAAIGERALALAEINYPTGHKIIGDTLSNLGEVYRALARYADAERVLVRALAIHNGVPGASSKIAATSHNLASSTINLGNTKTPIL